MRFVWILVAFGLLFSPVAYASNESARINGVAQFLIDRANDNYLYIFEKKIRDSNTFQCYFPETRANLDVGGLKELLYSRGLWEDSIEKDLNVLATRAVASGIENKLAVSDKAVDLANRLIELMQNFDLKFQGQTFPLTVIPINASHDLRDRLNGFSEPLGELVQAMDVFRQYRTRQPCEMPARTPAELKKELDPLLHLDKTLERFSKHLQAHAGELVLSDTGREKSCKVLGLQSGCDPGPDGKAKLLDQLQSQVTGALGAQKVKKISDGIQSMQELSDVIQDKNNSVTTKVAAALRLIYKTDSIEAGELHNMSRYIMFFAQVSDSTTSEQVNNLLKAYTLPSVSFYAKRAYGEHWMITAYLGMSAGKVSPDDPTTGKDNKAGIFAPIGLEWTYGTKSNSSVSVMLAPFDFGYPVSLRLNGIESDLKLKDIVAPSLSVSYGLREYPLCVGLAYQRGRVVGTTDQVERRVMLFVAFDMPLWGLK